MSKNGQRVSAERLLHTVMDQSIVTPGIFLENTLFLSEIVAITNAFGINVFTALMCIGKTQKS